MLYFDSPKANIGKNINQRKITPMVNNSVLPNLLTNKLIPHTVQIIPIYGINDNNAHHQGLLTIFMITAKLSIGTIACQPGSPAFQKFSTVKSLVIIQY